MKKKHLEWLGMVEAAVTAGNRLVTGVNEFDRACGHIVHLLEDSSTLLEAGSEATATFLAITAIEETAKLHIGMFRASRIDIKRSKDPLFRHYEKHRLAASPTVVMGSRLTDAIGKRKLNDIIRLARTGGLIALREACLYLDNRGGKLQVPSERVQFAQARALILFAVESFDDSLVGFSSRSFELGVVSDSIFMKWKGPLNSGEGRHPTSRT